MGKALELRGQKFARLQVMYPLARRTPSGGLYWLCLCDCGNETDVSSRDLRSGHIKSCGCLRIEAISLPEGQAHKNQVLRSYKYHARKRGLTWAISEVLFNQLLVSDCHYCGISPTEHTPYHVNRSLPSHNTPVKYNGIDRKDSDQGYTEGNVVPCCMICNNAKSALTYPDFIVYLHRIKNFQGLPQ
jgi:hypothetical protein